MTLPATFPDCKACVRFEAGPPAACLACARRGLELPGADSCPVCCQYLDRNGGCPNSLCHDRRRRIGQIHAIAYQAGSLRRVINAYKYRGERYWPAVLGRLLLAYLDEAMSADPPDLIVANPSYVGAGGQLFAHTEAVLAAAAEQDAVRGLSRWNFDIATPAAIVKTAPTLRSADEPAWYKSVTATDLAGALLIPDPARTAGRYILVYDDICTTGGQLNTVAAALLDRGGASRVDGVVLGRAPWRRH